MKAKKRRRVRKTKSLSGLFEETRKERLLKGLKNFFRNKTIFKRNTKKSLFEKYDLETGMNNTYHDTKNRTREKANVYILKEPQETKDGLVTYWLWAFVPQTGMMFKTISLENIMYVCCNVWFSEKKSFLQLQHRYDYSDFDKKYNAIFLKGYFDSSKILEKKKQLNIGYASTIIYY